MKTHTFLLFFFLYSIQHSFSQNISGKWAGKLTQQPGGFVTEYTFEMDLKQNGSQINGFSKIYTDDDFAIIQLTGSFDGNYFSFTEYAFVSSKIRPNYQWCIKKGTLKIIDKGSFYQMEGKWEGKSSYGDCKPGEIFLKKKKEIAVVKIPEKEEIKKDTVKKVLQIQKDTTETKTTDINLPVQDKNISIDKPFLGRKVKKSEKVFKVSQPKIKIEVWDYKEIDGDIISLYFNGEKILDYYTLSGNKKIIELEIQPDKNNFLILYAHNLGSKPPNTASIAIIEGDKRLYTLLNSDLNESDVINILYKE